VVFVIIKHYISVSTFDETPEVNAFELSILGEVARVFWLEENVQDYVKLELTVNKYTKEALDNNISLENRVVKALLKLSAKKLIEEVKSINRIDN